MSDDFDEIDHEHFLEHLSVEAGVNYDAKQSSKIFCIGFNKTGTTSTAKALGELGFKVAPQAPFEKLLYDWAERKFDRLIEICQDYEAFQDIPFSLPYTFQVLDFCFPGSKFILTVRTTSEMWFNSLVRFHSLVVCGREEKSLS
jgi:hypothetical protein